MCVDRGYRLLFQEAWARWEEEWQVTALAQALENPELWLKTRRLRGEAVKVQ